MPRSTLALVSLRTYYLPGVIWLILISLRLPAQNLVPNPSFEELAFCPNFFGAGGPLIAPPWQNGYGTTADILNSCATVPFVSVPQNSVGWQFAHTGEGYVGAIHREAGAPWHEYPQVQLSTPMLPDVLYHVGMYVSLANYSCGMQNVGLHISHVPPPPMGIEGLLVDPQIYYDQGFFIDTVNWVKVDGYYLAQGGEQWITIGNFELDANSPWAPNCNPNPSTRSYYYYDDVWVTPSEICEELDLDLSDDVTVCFEYTIDPGISADVHYVWSTGSTDPTITVYQSGEYGLTITDSCRVGYDHINVTILGITPVDIGPDSVMMCEGETFDIELDDEFGDYTWQDGSDEPEYTIETSGIYTVTFDDGCAQWSDTLVMDVISPPDPFTLGEDTLICNDDEFTITLDPLLGDFEWSDGTHDPFFTIDDEGTYALTISNVCGEESDDIEVIHDEDPNVELGPNTLFVCNGETVTFLLDEDEGSYVWQDSSTSFEYTISTPGLYSVTVTNACDSYDDEILVSLTPSPDVDLGPDFIVCPAQLPDTLNVSTLGGEVLWQDGSTLSQYIVTMEGLYSVTITNACGTGADSIQINVNDILPVVSLPTDMTVCEGDSIYLYNSGDQGINLWQDGSNADSLLAQTSGEYILEVTTVCGVGRDTVNLVFNPVTLAPDLGPDVGLCPGNSIILSAGDTFDTYIWQDMSTADTLVVSTPGTYSVSVSTTCGSAADTILINADGTPPLLTFPDSTSICTGVQITLDAAIGGVSYLWNDGSTQSTLMINSPGTYSLTVSNNCGTDADTIWVTDGGSLPVIDLGNTLQLCAGESQWITPDLSTADTWTWQDGSTTTSFLAESEGLVTIEASNECGSVYDTVNVSVLPGIQDLDLGNDTALCEAAILVLEITVPDVTITWFDGSGADQITVDEPGIYYATVANACGISTDSIVITSLGDIPSLSLGPDQFLCPGELITFDPGIPDVDYLWQDGTAAPTYSTTQPGEVILTITNACGSDADSVLIIESTQGPQLDLGPDITGCIGDTVIVQAGIGGVAYVWQDGSTNSSFEVSADSILTLHISNACGVDDDTISVQFITQPDPDLGPDSLLCDDAVMTLYSNADSPTINTWQDGSQSNEFVVTSGGLYVLQQENSCGIRTDSVVISYLSTPPPFSLGPDVTLCAGESILLQAPSTADTLIWQDGSGTTTMIADREQIYSLTISNVCGSAADEIHVDINPALPVLEIASWEICPGEILTLDATQAFEAAYIWSTGSSDPVISITVPGAYAVTVITDCGMVSQNVNIIPDDDCKPVTEFFIPNVFSPNGNNVNDVFTIQFYDTAEVVSVVGDIFDRWGNLIYQSDKHPFTWDGRFKDEPMNPGVYVYRFTLVYSNGVNIVTEKVTGDVSLVR